MPSNTYDGSAELNSPEVSRGDDKQTVRAIKDAAQAGDLVSRLIEDNKQRNIRNSRIMAKYNSERPYSRHRLQAEGLSWKSNFSTRPLSMLIDRVSPRFVQAVDNVKYLTSSKLPDSFPGATEKTDTFRKEVTDLIRQHPSMREFVGEIAKEDVLFGYDATAWLDDYSWFPTFYRQDDFFVPGGTKQCAKDADIVVLREVYLPHEIWEIVKDADAAEKVGWNIKNIYDEINNALPEQLRSATSDDARKWEDMVREINVATSHLSRKVVEMFSVLAVETSGKVSHWRVAGSKGNDDPYRKELFNKDDRFDSMEDAVHFFSFQQGNGTLQGSKGIGREVYAMASIIDRARNEVVDRLQLSGKLVVQGETKQLRKFKMNVMGNAIVLSREFDISDQKIDGKVDSFFTLDQYLSSLLDQIAGNVSPRHLQGDRVTKAQVDFFAAREEESKDVVLGRFLDQFANMVSTMQKRMLHPRVRDPKAKEMRERLLLIMSEDELEMLRMQPAIQVVRDYTEAMRQAIIIWAEQNKGNPLYDQKELEKRKTTALLDSEFAEATLIPDNDPTVEAEQRRLQQMELALLQTGAQVPVSPRDNHEIHLGMLREVFENTAEQTLSENPQALPLFENIIGHAMEHIKIGTLQFGKQQFSEFGAYFGEMRNRLARFKQHEQAANQAIIDGGNATDAAVMGATSVGPAPEQVPAEPPVA